MLAIAAPPGTGPNIAIQKYLNQKKVPALFIGSGASRWDDAAHFPWSIGFNPSYHVEGYLYATYLPRFNRFAGDRREPFLKFLTFEKGK